MTAGERIFIDLLPDSWKGPPPSLPMEVVRELAERARAAERALRAQRAAGERQEASADPRARLVQPTFVRFVFEMPDGVGVSSVLNEQKLTLAFKPALTSIWPTPRSSRPPNIASIKQKIDGDQYAGRDRADRRCRRALVPRGEELHRRHRLPAGQEQDGRRPRRRSRRRSLPRSWTGEAGGGKAGGEKPKDGHREIAPPTSETIAREARIEAKIAASPR